MLQSSQCSQARSAKRVRGNAEEQRVECSINIPEWKWQVGFQDVVDRMDGVGPNNHIHLHQWGGNIWKITNEKGHYSCTCKTKKWPYVIYSMASTRPLHLQFYLKHLLTQINWRLLNLSPTATDSPMSFRALFSLKSSFPFWRDLISCLLSGYVRIRPMFLLWCPCLCR